MASFIAWEAVTSLGECATETALLLRAGLTNVSSSRFIDKAGERVMMCTAPAIPLELGGIERVAALARLALTRLVESVESVQRPAVLLAVSEQHSAADFVRTKEAQVLFESIRAAVPGVSDQDLEIFPYGRAAGVVALRRALELVEHDRLVIWGGVDTMYDWPLLEALEREDRLLTAENVDGVRPGEGAAFVVLGPAAMPGPRVLGLGTGREPCPIGSDKPCQSLGLSAALESAVAPLRDGRRRSNCWLLDNSHEIYATRELQNVIARFGDVLGLKTELQMPLQELGDVGAAAVPLLAVLAAESWRLGYAGDETAVITGCSKDGARAALLLGAHDGFRPEEMAA
jgi:hypothetical protein